MKKLLIAGLALATVIALTGCGAAGYTTGRASGKASADAAKMIDDATGQQPTNLDSDNYYVQATGATASASFLNTEGLLGTGYPNTVFEEIGASVMIKKDGTLASVVVILTPVSTGDQMPVAFLSTGKITYNAATGFNFTAQLYDLDTMSFVNGGALINVNGVNFGNQMRITIKLQGSTLAFANSTPFLAGIIQ